MADEKRHGTSRLADKEYVDRTGGRVWERDKPFSPPGTDTLDESLGYLHRDFTRISLDSNIRVGASRSVHATFSAPHQPGSYLLTFDLVAEGRTWSETTGSQVATCSLVVADRRS